MRRRLRVIASCPFVLAYSSLDSDDSNCLPHRSREGYFRGSCNSWQINTPMGSNGQDSASNGPVEQGLQMHLQSLHPLQLLSSAMRKRSSGRKYEGSDTIAARMILVRAPEGSIRGLQCIEKTKKRRCTMRPSRI